MRSATEDGGFSFNPFPRENEADTSSVAEKSLELSNP